MGSLFIVATPIGNLGDITFRAVEVLKNVEIIACEDTRQTVKLLNAYGIRKHLMSCRAGNEAKAAEKLVEHLSGGADVAYASDAGTPGLSDPGAVLCNLVREAGFPVVPLPGASAFAALISVAGFGGRTVTFDGFMSPREGRRKRRLAELLEREENFILYESPFRILKLLRNLAELAPDRRICLGREMTKIHEEFLRGYPADILTELGERSSIKGEFAIMVEGRNFSQSYGENDDNVSERKG